MKALAKQNSYVEMSNNKNVNEVAGKVALVTGSSSGIGWAIADSFAQSGATVWLHGIEPQSVLDDRAELLRQKYKVEVATFSVDLSSSTALENFAHDILARGSCDILVNNAGLQHVAPIEKFEIQKWNELIHVHLTAAFRLIQVALPKMRKNSWGRIINMSSVHGLVASEQKSAYVAAKHGLIGLTKTVALETAEEGITCNAICPGWVRTPLVEKQIEARAKVSGRDFETESRALLEEKQPSKRFTELHHIASLAQFLCSEAGSNMTGVSIPVDGAWTSH